MISDLHLIKVNWSAPAHIHAFSTTRQGGVSEGQYQGLNLGLHVEDDPARVAKNRQLLSKSLRLADSLCWLTQTHSTTLLKLEGNTPTGLEADAAWSVLKNHPCIVMTADCLPLLVTDKQGSFVCAIHAGWRGLCDGIIEKSLYSICGQLKIEPQQLLVWLGPCIGEDAFVVGEEVRAQFIAENASAASAFIPCQDRYLADLHKLARLRLAPLNVAEISATEHRTFNEPELFYSYRRDGKTGRMASLIWIA
ncbi:MAG: peptidoglycan editing factor PgeF [Psychromonas sp.]|nr:peptidoglycan editing factor PgeF [Psychromonas sp.]